MSNKVPIKKTESKRKPIKLNKEVRELLPDLTNQQWDRIESDLSFREGFVLGIQVTRSEYNKLLDRILSIK